MKILLAILTTLFLFDDFKLPKVWDKNFVITLDHHGSMNGGFTDLKFTYDSCVYISGSNNTETEKKYYLMKEKDRVAILDKLRSLKIDKVNPKSTFVPVNDGWSQSICLGAHCIEGGTSVEMNDKDKDSFLNAYGYLEQFAIDKAKK